MAFSDILIGGIIVLGMTVISCIPILLEDRSIHRLDRERCLEISRISTAKLFNLIRLQNMWIDDEGFWRRISEQEKRRS